MEGIQVWIQAIPFDSRGIRLSNDPALSNQPTKYIMFRHTYSGTLPHPPCNASTGCPPGRPQALPATKPHGTGKVHVVMLVREGVTWFEAW